MTSIYLGPEICTGETHNNIVKMTFAKGAAVKWRRL
jgi:hypothetical protein